MIKHNGKEQLKRRSKKKGNNDHINNSYTMCDKTFKVENYRSLLTAYFSVLIMKQKNF